MTDIRIIHCHLGEVATHITDGIFIVCDRNTRALAGRIGVKPRGMMEIEATERNKNLETVLQICRWLLEQGADRNSFVLGVGGGITTDIVGFAASIYKRGIRFAFVPTTLLSQVDASIGGKNGVNLDSYKNMIGVIRQPEMTFICPEVLETLPYSQILSGASELLKTFIIDNGDGNYGKAIDALASYPDRKDISDLISAAASIKAGIAGRDPNEHGERRLLNLGHTFAHAIENRSNGNIGHGEAVAIGIILAAQLSERLGAAEEGLSTRLKADFERAGMKTGCPFDIRDLAEAMKKDKKADGQMVHFVLPLKIGHVETREMPVEDVIGIFSSNPNQK